MVKKTPNATLAELAEPFGVYPSTIDYHLKKLGITRKRATLYAERHEESNSYQTFTAKNMVVL